jgi:hypothetical protein
MGNTENSKVLGLKQLSQRSIIGTSPWPENSRAILNKEP